MRGALIGIASASYSPAIDFAVILGVAVVLVAVADFAFRRMQAK